MKREQNGLCPFCAYKYFDGQVKTVSVHRSTITPTGRGVQVAATSQAPGVTVNPGRTWGIGSAGGFTASGWPVSTSTVLTQVNAAMPVQWISRWRSGGPRLPRAGRTLSRLPAAPG